MIDFIKSTDNTVVKSRNENLKIICKDSIKSFSDKGRSPLSGYEPKYHPAFWNSSSIRNNTNCYAYMLNVYSESSSGFNLEPGNIAATQKEIITVKDIIDTIKADAEHLGRYFAPISFEEQSPKGTYKIAIVAKGHCNEKHPLDSKITGDSHFYRLNPDGLWSHKLGTGFISVCDAKGKEINNPEEAVRRYSDDCDYNLFVGYFAIGGDFGDVIAVRLRF